MPGEAGDVHLIDDHVPHRPAERLVALPVVIMNVDDDAAHRGSQIVGRPNGIVAVEQRLGVAQGIRVNQHLVAIEAKASAMEILWPIDTVGVMSARLEAPDVDVPEKKRLVDGRLELDDLDWLDVVLLGEEKQLNGGGISRED